MGRVALGLVIGSLLGPTDVVITFPLESTMQSLRGMTSPAVNVGVVVLCTSVAYLRVKAASGDVPTLIFTVAWVLHVAPAVHVAVMLPLAVVAVVS